MSVVRPDLRSSLTAAIEEARRTEVAVVAEGVSSLSDGPSGSSP